MDQQEHWNKQKSRDNSNKLLALIKKKPMSFNALKSELGCTAATLSHHLKILKGDEGGTPLIRKVINEKGKPVYEPIPERSNAIASEIGRYEAIQFIDSLKNPLYSHEPIDNYKTYSIFLEKFNDNDRKISIKTLENMKHLSFALNLLSKGYGLKKGEKGVLIITMIGE
jgi:transcriptional antiterminator